MRHTAAWLVAGGLTGVAVGQPVYPQDQPTPRFGTAEELAWEATHPRGVPKGSFPTPSGPHLAPGEYAPCEGILFAWKGGTSLNNIQRQMIKQITTIGGVGGVGGAKAYVAFDTASLRDSTMPTFSTNSNSVGTDVSKVIPVVGATDTIWLRDYGPRYIYEGVSGRAVRVISDHTYNRLTRLQDDAFPPIFGAFKHHTVYTLPLIHGGGNYHLNSLGEGFATQLIDNENSADAAAIIAIWNQHWGTNTTITPAFPTSVDATQHIDMWVQIIGDHAVMVSDWPANVGSTQDVICDDRAAAFASAGWAVTRLPARSLSGTHYTYTNVVMCNNLVLVPSYTNATMVQYNAPVLASWQAACPGKTIVQIPCENIVSLAGVMHCIVMHVPVHQGELVSGGQAPTAWLRTPRGGNDITPVSYAPGQAVSVKWIADDDVGVANVDVEFSRDGGGTWSVVPDGGATADDGVFTWTVPNVFTKYGKVRVTARDAEGRTGSNVGDGLFTVTGTPCPGDVGSQGGAPGADGLKDNNDFVVFIDAFFNGSLVVADVGRQGGVAGQDGLLDNNDFVMFIDAFFAPC